jgi:Restriction endonuclease fold toxin 7
VRVDAAGEDAVRKVYPIGPKAPITVGTRTRIPDGLTPKILSEVKNVKSLTYSSQPRDFASYAKASGREFDLYVRAPTDGAGATQLSGPLREAIARGDIHLKRIP